MAKAAGTLADKVIAGHAVRRLRRQLALTQAAIGLGAMVLARRFGAGLPRLREVTGACAAVAGGLFLAAALVA